MRNDHVVIVGDGVVGLTAALAFEQMGVEVSLIAPSFNSMLSSQSANKPKRMYAIHLASEALLRQLGAWPDFAKTQGSADPSATKMHSCKDQVLDSPEAFQGAVLGGSYRAMMVWEDVPEQLCFSASQLGKPYLGHIVDEAALLQALHQKIVQAEDITIYDSEVIALDSISGKVHLASGQCLQSSLIVGADGANSSVRELGGFDCDQASYQQQAIVATIGHEQPHHQRLIQRFLPEGPVALLALADAYQSSLVWTMSVQQAEKMLAVEPAVFEQALTEATQGVLGKCCLLDQRHGFPLTRRHVSQYWQGKVVVVGDAAHTVHPLAGQGLNLGLMDINRLLSSVVKARQKAWSLADIPTLRKWSRDSHAVNAKMQGAFSGINALFAKQGTLASGMRQIGMAVLQRVPLLKRAAMRRACGIDI